MQRYDIVIIGSGLGGLLCGCLLSKEGYSVCILEKNNQIGGCLQTFERNGTRFDTGLHYIGALDPGQTLFKFFNYFGINGKLQTKRLDSNGFDRINLNGSEFSFSNGRENFINNLSEKFPNAHNNIKNYIDKVYEISEHSNLYNFRNTHINSLIDYEFIRMSVQDFLQTITSEKKIQNVLASTNPLYAGIPDRTPAYIHAMIQGHYIDSAWRLINGGSQLADVLAKLITDAGGIILKNTKAISFNFKNKSISEVKLENGESFEADYFISNIHPARTIEMVKPGIIRPAYRERINNLQNTIGAFTVYIVFRKNKFKYLNYNYYHYNTDNVWTVNYKTSEWPTNFILFTPATAKEQVYSDHAILMAYMHYDEVKKWEKTTIEKRGNEYLEFKQNKAESLLTSAEKVFPGFKSQISTYYTSTPLTYRDYTGTEQGSMYGIMRDCLAPEKSFIFPRTRVPNLLLTGQNINSHGILGVTISSILTCSELLGFESLISKIKNA